MHFYSIFSFTQFTRVFVTIISDFPLGLASKDAVDVHLTKTSARQTLTGIHVMVDGPVNKGG